MSLALNDCTAGKGSGPVFEALQVTLGNIHSLKNHLPSGIATYDTWEQCIRDAMKAAMCPRWELLQDHGHRSKVVGELPTAQEALARRIVVSVNLLEGIDLEALKVLRSEDLSPFRIEQAAERIKELASRVEDLAVRLADADARLSRGPVQGDLFGALK